ncbi:MAG: hypothetical protein RMX63_34590 [Aulosira sp. ZfuCHP01]|nr:hypothetical protein [Aulosira sp. DedVER01a]MDZ8056555.1 hypothetical protein [Aulosira sp. ZfuCHP01]
MTNQKTNQLTEKCPFCGVLRQRVNPLALFMGCQECGREWLLCPMPNAQCPNNQ